MVFSKKNFIRKTLALGISIMLTLSIVMSFGLMTAYAAASGPPSTPILVHDNWDNDGNYNISMNMWWGNNGTSWKLYENDKLVYTGALTDNSTSSQTASKAFSGVAAGSYTYKCELINSFGTAASSPITVTVGSSSGGTTGGTSGIKISGVDDVAEALQLTINQGTSDYALSATGATSPNFVLSTNNSSVISYQIVNGSTLRINGLKSGRASLKIKETTGNKIRYIGVRVKTADGKLPGMPDYLSVGSVSEDSTADLDFWKDYGAGLTNKRMDIRYIYLNGGPVNGWRTWGNGDGGRVISYIRESKKLGIIPFFVYYNIPDGGESYNTDKQHMESDSYMQSYFKDLKFALDLIKQEGGDELVGMVLEPDFIGYMMQNSGKKPTELMAKTSAVYSAGILNSSTDPVFPDTMDGLIKAINYTISKYAPNAYFGWQFNLWASPGITTGIPITGLMRLTDTMGITNGRSAIVSETKEIAKYYMNGGITSYGADFVSIDKYGLDAGISSPSNPSSSTWFWNIDHWNNYLLFSKTLHQESQLPVVLWQVPVGHINSSLSSNPYNNGLFPDLANSSQHYEDSAPTFFLGDTFSTTGTRFNYFSTNLGGDSKLSVSGNNIAWGSHAQEAVNSGIISVLFGAGVGDSTDGVGSPPTDSYWWITKVQTYYTNPVPLPGSQPPAGQAPDPASLSVNSTPNSGNYTVSVTIPAGNTATSVTLYEGTQAVKSQAVSSDQSTSQVITYAVTNKLPGTYIYKADLTNSYGTTTSSSLAVTVQAADTVASPLFSPASGTYSSPLSVSISCATSDAAIRYTTDGTEPVSTSTQYTAPITISATTTIKAKAFKSGMTESATSTATYTISAVQTVATPTFSPAGGSYSSAQSVTISCGTSGATIRYTTNGSDPTSASSVYTGPIAVSSTTTIKAKAFKSGMNDSTIAIATYTISDNQVKPWAPNTAYKAGDTVTYGGKTYKCVQPHTSLPGWEPSNVPALWQVV